jgi:hypothetical protein
LTSRLNQKRINIVKMRREAGTSFWCIVTEIKALFPLTQNKNLPICTDKTVEQVLKDFTQIMNVFVEALRIDALHTHALLGERTNCTGVCTTLRIMSSSDTTHILCNVDVNAVFKEVLKNESFSKL